MTNEAKKDESVEVVAIERGHDGVSIREEGERFHIARSRLKDGSSWFVEADKAEAPVPAAAPTSKRPPGAGPNPK